MKANVLAFVCAALLAQPLAAHGQETAAGASAVQAVTPTTAPDTPPAEAASHTLPLGAYVQLEFVNAMSSDTAIAGQEVALRLAEPITVDGAVIVPAGTPGVGVILDVQANGIAGRPGMISAAARHLDFNGERIGLQGMIAGGAGQNNVLLSRAVGGLVGVLIRGQEFEIAAGERVSARLAGGPPEVAAPVEGKNPVPAPPPGRALVVFYQLAQMGTEFYTYGAAENGVPLARLRGNQYLPVEVDPGLHEFEVLAPMGGRRTGVMLHQEIFEGQMIFIRHDRDFLSPGDEENFLRRRLRMAPPPAAE